jgi:hypothetical protein
MISSEVVEITCLQSIVPYPWYITTNSERKLECINSSVARTEKVSFQGQQP